MSEIEDEEINQTVAEWLDAFYQPKNAFKMMGSNIDRRDGRTVAYPDFCNDPAAAWKLLEKLPSEKAEEFINKYDTTPRNLAEFAYESGEEELCTGGTDFKES